MGDFTKDLHFIIPSQEFISGGNIYNQQIIQHLQLDVKPKTYQLSFSSNPNVIKHEALEVASLKHNTIVIDSLLLLELFKIKADLFKQNSVIGLIHLPSSLNPAGKLKSSIEKEILAFKACRMLICTSHFLKDVLIDKFEIPASIINVVEPGVSQLSIKQNYVSKPSKLVCISNVIHGKGLESILSVCSKLSTTDWSLDIFGEKKMDAEYYQFLVNKIQNFNLINKVRFMGTLPQAKLLEELTTYDLLICASEFETFGMAIAEAIQTGLPYISTKVGEFKKFKKSGSGDYFELQNERQFLLKLEELMKGGARYKNICLNAGKKTLKSYSWSDSAQLFKSYIYSIEERSY